MTSRSLVLRNKNVSPIKHRSLSKSDIKCLIQTKIAAKFGKKFLTFEEMVSYTNGNQTKQSTWMRLKLEGYVKNIRSLPYIQLTVKGENELKKRNL